MPNAEEVSHQIAVHDAVCTERWKHVNSRLGRIDAVLAVIVLLSLMGETAEHCLFSGYRTLLRSQAELTGATISLSMAIWHANFRPPTRGCMQRRDCRQNREAPAQPRRTLTLLWGSAF